MPLSFALSITHFFSSVGADAGFAALIGLAILILLYFAHARETSNIRNQLAEATERLEELERRGGGVAPSVGARQPAGTAAASAPPAATSGASASSAATSGAPPRPAGGQPPPVAPPPVSARALSTPPLVPPAGVGAPPLSDATRVVPVEQSPGDRAALSGNPAALGDRGSLPDGGPGRTPSPVTAAAGGNGFSAAGATRGAAGSPRSLLEHGIPGERRAIRWVVPAVVLVLAAVIAVVLVLVLPGRSSSDKPAVVHRHHADIAAAPAGVVPSSVTVAVVNGTNVNQLAHHIADRLTGKNFKEGTLATGNSQSLATTTVGYLPGERNDALAVAHALKLPASAVRPATQSTERLVCPDASSCTADVIVLAGSNLAPKR